MVVTREMAGSRQDRPLAGRGGALVGAAVAAIVVVVLGALVLYDRAGITAVDRAIAAPVHDWALQAPWAVDVSELLGLIGGVGVSTLAAIIVVVVLVVARRWWVALTLGVLAAFAPFLTDVIKNYVERPRPEWGVPIATPPDPWSFPSGHATGGIAVWLAIGVALASLLTSDTAKAWFVLPWAVLGFAIGVSRVVLGLHWPSDVLAGWCLAAAVAGVAAALFVIPRDGGA